MNKIIKIAVIFDQKLKSGGGYQQAINASLLISKLDLRYAKISYYNVLRNNIKILEEENIRVKFIPMSLFEKMLIFIKTTPRFALINQLINLFFPISIFEKVLSREEIDLVYFTSPSRLAADLKTINFIFTIWDLCHRDNPEFPEVNVENRFQIREKIYKEVLPRACAIIVDSEEGKSNLIKRYLVDDNRVHVIAFDPAIKIKNFSGDGKNHIFKSIKYNLKNPYIFYPAQYWPHKNHVYILEGIKEIESSFSHKINAIFTGSDKGNKKYLIEYANKIGLSERVYFLDFVSDQEIIDLYKSSLALVMPSYFGPTNLPPIEAFCLGIPVLYPDMYGMREQVEGAALLINLSEPFSMASQINKLLKDPLLRDNLIKSGKSKYIDLCKDKKELILEKIVKDFYFRRICWK